MAKLMCALTSDEACINGLISYRLLKDGVDAGGSYPDTSFKNMGLMEQFQAHVKMPSLFMMNFLQTGMRVLLQDDEDIDPYEMLDLHINMDVTLNAAKDGVRIFLEDARDKVIYSDASIMFADIAKAIHYHTAHGRVGKAMAAFGIDSLPVLNLVEGTSGDFYDGDAMQRSALDEWLFAVISGPMFSFIHKGGLKPDGFAPNGPFC